jgi:hypothetical protein
MLIYSILPTLGVSQVTKRPFGQKNDNFLASDFNGGGG